MSKVSICNEALSEILSSTIVSLDDNSSKEARMCNLFYDTCRKELIHEFDWNFVRKVVRAAVVADVDTLNWGYVYQYPTDALRIRAVTDNPSLNALNVVGGRYNLKEENLYDIGSSDGYRVIYSNIPSAYIVYSEDIKDVNRFDIGFRTTLVYKLAVRLASSLTGNPELGQILFQKYMMSLEQAKSLNALEGNQMILPHNKYILSRGR